MSDKKELHDEQRKELLALLKKYAYKKGEFTLSSGKKSEHYVNCKPVTLSSIGLFHSSCLLREQVEDGCVAVAGLTLGADPLVSGVSIISTMFTYDKLNALIIRKEPKGYGTESQVEGPLPSKKGSVITVLEDVITTGGSALKAVKVLRDLDYKVNRIVTIVDRQEGGERAIIDAGLELKSLFTIDDLCQE